jgi:hypothetical protein
MTECMDCGTPIDPRAKRCKPCNYARGANHKHGHAKDGDLSPTYRCWMGMMARCSNPAHNSWDYYGGKGIKVCIEWHEFDLFLADMGERPGPEYSLDRIDPDKGYEPGNVRWLLLSENVARSNRRAA